MIYKYPSMLCIVGIIRNTMKKNSVVERIMRIDEDIIALVKKRSTLLHELRVKGYVPSEVEKTLRQHWERYASDKTKDSSFVRTLFKILQQVEMQECGELNPGRFILTPSKATVAYSIDGTVNELCVHLILLASTVRAQPVTLQNVAISDCVFATIKMLQSIGVGITWEGTTVSTHSFQINVNDIVVHLGESEISLYALLALSIVYMGHVKCVGGLSLSLLSLTSCKEVLMQCGVRLTSLGGVSGIPARIESTRQIPEHLCIMATLPRDMLLMLCTLLPCCGEGTSIDIENHPERDSVVECMKSIYMCLDIDYTLDGYTFRYPQELPTFPTTPKIHLDPYHTFVRAVVPYFTGGSATIRGNIAKTPLHNTIVEQLQLCGLAVQYTDEGMTVTKEKAFALTEYTALPSCYFPILFTMFLSSVRTRDTIVLPVLPEGIEMTEVQSFLEALSIRESHGKLIFEKEQNHTAWIAPNAYWIIGYAFAGFLFPGITLANPSDVTAVLPHFWRFYNSLPHAVEHEAPVLQENVPSKRRIIVR